MEHILLIHVGRAKTGSTALQIFLYENREKLEDYGWCYPSLKEEFPFVAGNGCPEKNGDIFLEEIEEKRELSKSKENWNIVWEGILEKLKEKNVIISAEELSGIDITQKFLIKAKQKYSTIKVIIYLRRQDRAIEAMWNQRVKGQKRDNRSFEEFISSEEYKKTLFYKKNLDIISEIIGKENIIVRVYEKQRLINKSHKIAEDFLSSIGIEPEWEEWKDCYVQNPRLYGNFIEIKRILNSLCKIEKEINYELYESILMKLSKIHYREKNKMGGGVFFAGRTRKIYVTVQNRECANSERVFRTKGWDFIF